MESRAGGPVVAVDRMCRGMARLGVEPIVLTTDALRAGGSGTNDEEHAGASPCADACRADDYETRVCRAAFRRYAYSPSMRVALDSLVPACDVVHVHTLWAHTTRAAIRACRRHDVPCVVMPHGMLDPHSLARKALRKRIYGHLFEFPALRSVAGMVYTTVDERRLAESAVHGLPPGHVVALGADAPPDDRPTLAREFLKSRPHLAGRKIITFLGRIHSKKGLDLLIPAFADIAAGAPDAHLLVIGPDDENLWPRLGRRIDEQGLSSRVTRIDMVLGRAKWAALAASDVFVLPSYQENFAIAVAEAMRSGTPVVITDRVNIWRTVEAQRGGRVVPPDARAVADAIRATLASEADWHRMSMAAARAATEHFDWATTAKTTLDVYRRAIGDAGRRTRQDSPLRCLTEIG